MSYEELIADEDYDEKDAMIIHLQYKIEKLEEEKEELEWEIKDLKEQIKGEE